MNTAKINEAVPVTVTYCIEDPFPIGGLGHEFIADSAGDCAPELEVGGTAFVVMLILLLVGLGLPTGQDAQLIVSLKTSALMSG